jgi:threonine dehydrogenase-like Zn-dependent dehydrogenase
VKQNKIENDAKDLMQVVQFNFKLPKLMKSYFRGKRNPSGYWAPGGAISYISIPKPKLPGNDWVLVKNVYCGICGSDFTEVQLKGAPDNPLRGFISTPHTIGHEFVGIIEQTGSAVTKVKVGDRIVVYPVLTCKPRGISPECPRCQEGDYNHCANFDKGFLSPGMILGTVKNPEGTNLGGYAPYVAIHESQAIKIPKEVTFEQAVLTDPITVAFHSCLHLDPKPDQVILVYGVGMIGLASIMILKNLFHVKHIIGVGRFPFHVDQAKKYGAEKVFLSSGQKLIEEIAEYTHAKLIHPYYGNSWSMDGVDGIVDTLGAPFSLEIGVRILKCKGTIVFTGISTPARFEWTPWYFKELNIIGSNGASMETFEGKTKLAYEWYLEFVKENRLDPTGLLTHKFPLSQYQEAFNTMAAEAQTKRIKVAFDFTVDPIFTKKINMGKDAKTDLDKQIYEN